MPNGHLVRHLECWCAFEVGPWRLEELRQAVKAAGVRAASQARRRGPRMWVPEDEAGALLSGEKEERVEEREEMGGGEETGGGRREEVRGKREEER